MAEQRSNLILEASGLKKSFGAVTAARDIHIAIERDSFVGLIGTNGAGKTTLMKSIVGLLAAASGSIGFDGTDLRKVPTHARNGLGIAYMPEDRRLIPELREFAPRKALQLSGGQQKLAALGRALMYGRKLPLDEPFEGVAPALAKRLVQVISSLKSQGLTVLLSESDLQYSESLVDGLLSNDRGSLQRSH